MRFNDQKTFANKCKYACSLFHEIRKFQQQGLLCDTKVLTGNKANPVKVHRIVLMSAKSFDSDYYSDFESSESDIDDDTSRTMSCSDETVFEEAYPSDEENDNVATQMDVINGMRRKGECCDVTLQAPGISYQAHKVVLAAASEYFKIMFTSSMKEKNMEIINLNIAKQLDVSQLSSVLDYIYTGEIVLNDENILPTLCLSVFFQIPTLTERCQGYLISEVSKVNCCGFYVLAKCFALEELKIEASQFIHDHFPELEGLSHDINLLGNVELPVYLASDTLGKSSEPSKNCETHVLGNVMEWLSYAKFHDANELLRHVRFSLVPKKVIQTHCEAVKEVKAPSEDLNSAQNFLKKAMQYHERLYEQPLLQAPNTQLRTTHKSWVCLDGVLAPESIRLPATSLHAQAPDKETKIVSDDEKIRDPFHSVVVMNGFVFVLGGTRQTAPGYSSEVIRYDARLDAWIPVASMMEDRGDFYACAIGDYLYVFGGRNKHGAVSSCERYDPRKNKWERISDLPEALYMMAGAVEGGKVYISGGFNEYEAVGTTLRYDPDEDQWEEIPAYMFKDRGYHVLVNDGEGHLWAIGGIDNPFAGRNVWEVEQFDVESEMWMYIGQVLAVQPFLSIQRLNAFRDAEGRICVFAVTNIDNSPMMRYDVKENLWEALESPTDYFNINTDAT